MKLIPFSIFVIRERSMFPSFVTGDHVLVLAKSNYKKGEVVVFKKDERNFIKRIKKNYENKYLVGGDNKEESVNDFIVNKKDINGKVILKY